MSVFELDPTKLPALVWWRADATEGWMSLDHLCGGHRHSRLHGWVLPALVSQASTDLLWALDGQEFAAHRRGGSLAYEVADEHCAAYAYLRIGQDGGDIDIVDLNGELTLPGAVKVAHQKGFAQTHWMDTSAWLASPICVSIPTN